MTLRSLAAVLLVAVLAVPGEAGFGGVGRTRPILLELDGHTGTPDPDAAGETKLSLLYGGKTYPFALKELRVLGSGPLAADILAAVRPYNSSFVLQGPNALMKAFTALRTDEWVVIKGYLQGGSRYILVSSVTPRAR